MAILVKNKEKRHIYDNQILSPDDKKIASYIARNDGNEDFTNTIWSDESFYTRYHLSDYRSSILRWYPFKEDAKILEIGAEYGAITGALCDAGVEVHVTECSIFQANLIKERYKNRDNLYIHIGDIYTLGKCMKFDYIICFDQLEYVKNDEVGSFFSLLNELLEETGTIFFGIHNTYGINNLIGEKDIHTGIPFDCFSRCSDREVGRGYTRTEIIEMFEHSPFKQYKFYYPMADYYAPRALFTDKYLPKLSDMNRLVTYHRDYSTIIADDITLYEDSIKNGVYSFLSNTFLVECKKTEPIDDGILAVYLSGNKDREKALAAIIYENGENVKVKKKSLYANGITHIESIYSLMKEIEDRGVDILHMECEENALYMEYVEKSTVHQHLIHLVEKQDRDGIIDVYDRLWKCILQSSDISKTSRPDVHGGDIILENVYVDMIYTNCFWNDGRIIFFDQEYVRHDWPALFTMYRNIYFSLREIAGLSNIVSSEELFDHFGIDNEHIEIFKKLGQEFGKDEQPRLKFCEGNTIKDQILLNRKRLLLGT